MKFSNTVVVAFLACTVTAHPIDGAKDHKSGKYQADLNIDHPTAAIKHLDHVGIKRSPEEQIDEGASQPYGPEHTPGADPQVPQPGQEQKPAAPTPATSTPCYGQPVATAPVKPVYSPIAEVVPQQQTYGRSPPTQQQHRSRSSNDLPTDMHIQRRQYLSARTGSNQATGDGIVEQQQQQQQLAEDAAEAKTGVLTTLLKEGIDSTEASSITRRQSMSARTSSNQATGDGIAEQQQQQQQQSAEEATEAKMDALTTLLEDGIDSTQAAFITRH